MSSEQRRQVLKAAEQCVTKDRNLDYAEAEDNFLDIARLWSVYKTGVEFSPHDVTVMCLLIKVARLKQSPHRMDHWIDIAGYAACGWGCVPSGDTGDVHPT